MSDVETLVQRIEAIGWRAAVVPFARRSEAVAQVVARHERGELDEAFYQEYLAPLLAEPVPERPTPRSLILVAAPERPVRLRFTLDGESIPVIVAPGYVRRPRRPVVEVVAEILAPLGFSAARVDGPQKTMATLSGFARYGRNNLAYVEGLGSLCALASLVSDLPCDEEPAHEQARLARCQACRSCCAACPTGAIAEDRFLLRAERCLSFWNERSPEVAFPAWIDPSWHNALFGCLLCQQACPENRACLAETIDGPRFDEETTRALLAGTTLESVPEAARSTLEEWRLAQLLDYLPRNLGVLVPRARLRERGQDKEGP